MDNFFSYMIKRCIVGLSLMVSMSTTAYQQVYAIWMNDANPGYEYGDNLQIPNFTTVLPVFTIESDNRVFSARVIRFDLNDIVNDITHPVYNRVSEESMPWFIVNSTGRIGLYVLNPMPSNNQSTFAYQGIYDQGKLVKPNLYTFNNKRHDVYYFTPLTKKQAQDIYNKYTKKN